MCDGKADWLDLIIVLYDNRTFVHLALRTVDKLIPVSSYLIHVSFVSGAKCYQIFYERSREIIPPDLTSTLSIIDYRTLFRMYFQHQLDLQ